MRIFDVIMWPFYLGIGAIILFAVSLVGLIIFGIIMLIRKSRY